MNTLLAPDGPVVQTIKAAFPAAFAIYAFGSQVQGTAGPQSDLDLAVLVPGYALPAQLWDLGGALAGLYECFILSDKTDLDAARAGLLADIKADGRIYAR